MSTTIDERVVEMRFDNKQFENNVQTSLSTLDKLKQSLNLTGASKGLENVSSAAKNVDMSGLSGAVETVRYKFSALEVMAVTALANITNSAINAGKRIVSALTIDPIKTGFEEYELKMNSVQTIMSNTASKGTTMADVTRVLDELNTYADKTIYNFAEMTRNIGTFTAAGIGLEESANAIQGIANLAAASGSNSQQASTAMYQLSQALAAGTVKLMDWNSVVNAGMGGQLFQDALKKTSELLGTGAEAAIKAKGSFRESLQTGWLTSEVLTETLKKFTTSGANEYVAEYTGLSVEAVQAALDSAEAQYGEAEAIDKASEALAKKSGKNKEEIKSALELAKNAEDAATKVKTLTQLWDTLKESAQSGWSQSWEIIVGDFEEAKELFTEISDTLGAMINASAEARNNVLQGWKDLGGRTAVIDALRNAFEGVMSIVKPVKEAFREIFPPVTAQQLYDLSEGLKNLTEKFKIGDTTAKNLKRTFKGMFAVFDIGLQGVKAFLGGFADLIGYVIPAGDGILGITACIGDFIVSIDEAVKSSNIFGKTIETIGNFLKPVADGIKTFAKAISDAFSNVGGIDTSGLSKFSDSLIKRIEPLTKLGGLLKKAFEGIAKVIEWVSNLIGGLFDAFFKAFNTGNFNSLIDLINTGLLGGILLGIKKFIDSLTNIAESSGSVLGGITDILDGVKGCLEGYQSQLKAGTLLKIAGAIAVLAGALVVLSLIDSDKLTSSLTAMSVMFAGLFGSMAIFDEIADGSSFKSMGKVTTGMLALSTSILILSSALVKISKLDWEGVSKGLVGVAGLSAILVKAATKLSESSKRLVKGSTGLIAFAGAIVILTKAVKELGGLDPASLAKGLVGVGVLVTELAAFMRATNLNKMGINKGAGLLILAAAINVLAKAVDKFAALDTNGLIKGLSGVAVVLAELTAFVKFTGNATKVISTAVGLTILGAAMIIFSKAVSSMGSIPIEQIGKGLLTMAGALAEITVALNFMPKNMISTGVGLVAVAGALVILSNALSNMGGMSWDEIARGLTTLGVSLGIITVAMKYMTGALPGAAALLVVSAALAIFTPVIKGLGNMSWWNIAKGLITLAGAFTVIGVAGTVLSPLAPALLSLSGAIALLGVACLAVGAGVMAFSAGLSSLAVTGAAGAAALVSIISSLLSLIPVFLQKLGEGVVAFANVIADGAPAIGEAVTSVILAIVETLTESIPSLLECLGVMLSALLEFIVSYAPMVIDAGMKLIIALLEGIANNIQQVIDMAVRVMTEFLDGISSQVPEVIQAGFDLIIDFINGLAAAIEENTPILVEAIVNLAGSMVQGLIDGLIAGVTSVGESVIELGESALNAIMDFLGINSPSKEFENVGKYSVDGFVNGISNGLSKVVETIKQIPSKCLSILKNGVSGFVSAGKNLINSLIKGLKSGVSSAVSTIKQVPTKCISTLKGYISSFTSSGKNLINGIINGFKNRISTAVTTVRQIPIKCISTLRSYISSFTSAGKNLINGLVSGFRNMVSAAVSAVKQIPIKCISALKGYVSSFTSAGKNLISGFVNGIKSKISEAANWAANLARNALNAAKKALGIKSPSREFEEVGVYSVEGFIGGLKQLASSVGKAAKNIGKTALDSLGNPMSKIADVLSSDIDTNPTIRPVLDLSQIRAGSSQLGSMFGQQTVALAGVNEGFISNNANALADILSKMEKVTGSGNAEIVSAIAGLREEFGALVETIGKLQVVMDSGTVVGELIGEIDNRLGQIETHKGRGN